MNDNQIIPTSVIANRCTASINMDLSTTSSTALSIPDRKVRIHRLLTEANLLRSRNKIADAIRLFDEVIQLDASHVEAYNSKGLCCKQFGDYVQAMAAYQHALRIDPTNWCAHNNQGVIYKESGLFQEAIDSYRAAIDNGPPDCVARENMATVLTDLGTRLKMAGAVDAAMSRYNEAITFNPKYAPAYFNLGVVYSELNRVDEALRFYNTALQHNPQYVEALCNIGVIYKNASQLAEAIQYYERALRINPNFQIANNNIAIAYTDMGTSVKNAGNIHDGIRYYKRALLHNTKYPDAWYNLGVAYSELNDSDEAIICYEMAVHINPKCAEAYNNLGVIYKDRGNLDKSIAYYQNALVANPCFAQTLNNLGVIYTMLGKFDEAYLYCQKAIEANPRYAEAYNNLGVLYRDEGRIEEAIKSYEYCLKLDPNSRNAGQNRLLALNYLTDMELREMTNAHREWGARFGALFEQYRYWDNERSLDRPLRIGYISPDFFVHSVSYFIEAALKYSRPEKTFVVCYSNVAQPDKKTERFRKMVPLWRQVCGMKSKQVAELIREDKIDILVELTGHTAGNRLDVMAHRPAPIQVTWIGYPNTTGLPTIDYRFTDAIADSVDTKQDCVEELVRLPGCFLCYTPSTEAPDVVESPAMTNGFITFGSFNNIAKINSGVLELWCKILTKIPTSRLLLKSKPFASDTVRNKILLLFESHGIASRRVDLLPLLPSNGDHLRAYSLIDISLDTFPYAGTTTTCEALYMGVPVVSLKGDRHAHNVGISLLSRIPGLQQLIVDDQDAYINAAVELAQDIPALNKLRLSIRDAMIHSSLCDGEKFVDGLSEVYRGIWQRWVTMGTPTATTSLLLHAPNNNNKPSIIQTLNGNYIISPSTASTSSATSMAAISSLLTNHINNSSNARQN